MYFKPLTCTMLTLEEGSGNPLQYSCLERSLVGYSLWGHKESDTTARLSMHANIIGLEECYASNYNWFYFHIPMYILSTFSSLLKAPFTAWGCPSGSDGKESACNVGDLGSISGSRRSPGEGNGYPLQYSCLENSMVR